MIHCTLHPTPYNPHPSLYTLHPTTQTLNPNSQTLDQVFASYWLVNRTHLRAYLRQDQDDEEVVPKTC